VRFSISTSLSAPINELIFFTNSKYWKEPTSGSGRNSAIAAYVSLSALNIAKSAVGQEQLSRETFAYWAAGPRLTRASACGRIHFENAACTCVGESAT